MHDPPDVRRPIHSERTWAHPWMWLLLWGACLTAFFMTAALFVQLVREPDGWAGNTQPEVLVATSALTLVLPAVISAIFGRLEVDVWPEAVHLAFGPVRIVKRRITFDHVERVEAVKIRPIRDFGGWGIRFRGHKTAWTISGDRAVRLDLDDGREVFVGSRYPHRLAERIQVAMRTDRKATED